MVSFLDNKKNFLLFFSFLFISLFLISIVSARGFNAKVDNEDVLNESTLNVNHSTTSGHSLTTDSWITGIGQLDTVFGDHFESDSGTLKIKQLYHLLDGSNFGFSDNYLSYSNPNFAFNETKLNATTQNLINNNLTGIVHTVNNTNINVLSINATNVTGSGSGLFNQEIRGTSDEVVSDAEFDGACSTDWTCTSGWSIAGGEATLTTGAFGDKVISDINPSPTITAGKEYVYCANVTTFTTTGAIAYFRVEIGNTNGVNLFGTGYSCETLTATNTDSPRFVANKGGATINDISVSFLKVTEKPSNPSKFSDTDFLGDVSFLGGVDMSLADVSMKTLTIPSASKSDTSPTTTSTVDIISFTNTANSPSSEGSPIKFLTGNGSDSVTSNDGNGGDIIYNFGTCGGACSDARNGVMLVGMSTAFDSGLNASIVQIQGDILVNGSYLTLSPSDENYIPMTRGNELPNPESILSNDYKLDKDLLFEKEKIYEEWVEYPYTKYQCLTEWDCGDYPDLDRPVYKSVNKLDISQLEFNNRLILSELFNNMKVYNNLTDFDTGIMAENIYTQSKVINLIDNYALKFLDADLLSDKLIHKNKETLILPDKEENVLNMEDRIVDLEGAFNDHMFCMYANKKYDDYRDCMLDINPKNK